MAKNFNGWEKLFCSFFTPICRHVLDSYLADNDFIESKTKPTGAMVYKRNDIFLEIGYLPETCPDYELRIILGLRNGVDENGRSTRVPLWYILGKSVLQKLPALFWTFKNEADLERLLLEVKNSFLETNAKSLWLNPDQLSGKIEEFLNENV